MKDTLRTKEMISGNHLLDLWEKYSKLVESEQDDETITKENLLLEEIESLLPFKSKMEHEHWLNVLQGYKFWEDFEELTLNIIKRNTQKKIDDLLKHYQEVALDVCQDANFYDLFETFAKLSHGWVKPMSEWNDFYKSMANDEWMMGCFHEIYEEIYGKQYQLKELLKMNYFGFEDTPNCMFFKNDESSISDLLDCIFERYIDGLEDDEKLWFFQRLIKELI